MIYVLKKTSENGAVQEWKAAVDQNRVTYDWGQEGGKRQKKTVVFKEGKNVGKKNETSPAEQCLFEVENKIRKKIEQEGFELIVGKLTTVHKTAIKTHTDVPKVMLAAKYEEHKKKIDCLEWIIAQAKLDGNRCSVNIKTCKMYSRARKEILSIPGLAEFVKEACKKLPDVVWVDGELFSDEITFNEIQSIIRKSKSIDIEKASKIKFNMFDYMTQESCKVRMDKIAKGVQENERVKIVESYTIHPNEIKKWHDKFVEEGHEGLIIRMMDKPYEHKRSHGLLKYKMFQDEEFKVVGFKSEKNNPNELGAVTCVMKDGQTFNARPKMTKPERDEIWKNQDNYLGKMATIKFQEKDEKTGIPRFPVLKGFRDEGDIDE